MVKAIFNTIGVFLFAATISFAADFQYSVVVDGAAGRRAYLWIPPSCKRVRGLIFCLNNMLEERLTTDPAIRKVATECGLGIVWIHPGGDKTSPLDGQMKQGNARQAVEKVLSDLADESGYAEIKFAPLLVEEHSACSPFVYGIQSQMPDRVFAAVPLKGWYPGWKVTGIPNLQIASSWAEHGESWKNEFGWRKDIQTVSKYRAQNDECLMGEFTDIRSGHYNFTPTCAKIIALFIKKAVKARIPAKAPTDGPVTLIKISPSSGWLIEPSKLGTAEGKPAAYRSWTGDTKNSFWYFDKELATTINNYMMEQLNKKPQMIQSLDKGQPVILDKKGMNDFRPVFESDGATFKVNATWYSQSPYSTLFGGQSLGHVDDAIQYKVSSGALDQVGPNSFRVGIHRGILLYEGNPWEPHVIQYNYGNKEYSVADRPVHIIIDLVNKEGEPQSLNFPAIGNQPRNTKRIQLNATASSGLPVQYFLISGPGVIEGNVLVLDKIPPRSKFPVRVLVGAYQWGSRTGNKFQSTAPVIGEFFIEK